MAMLGRSMKAVMNHLITQNRRITTGLSKMRAATTTGTASSTVGEEGTRATITWRKQPSLKEQLIPKGKPLGDYVPVYVALGMISLSVSLGLYTAKQELMHAPDVRVRKSKRETLPEVVEPEYVAHKSEDFINKSLFRKLGHIEQGLEMPASNTLPREPKLESLKDVGVEPVLEIGLRPASRG